jgi:hypothetical protein
MKRRDGREGTAGMNLCDGREGMAATGQRDMEVGIGR